MLAAYGLAWLMTSGGRLAIPRIVKWLTAAVGALAVLLLVAHVAMVVWPDAPRQALGFAYLSLPRDTYQLTATTVLNGLLWSTDLRNPRAVGAVLGLLVIAACLWRWQRS